jgi:hypothetical protein
MVEYIEQEIESEYEKEEISNDIWWIFNE